MTARTRGLAVLGLQLGLVLLLGGKLLLDRVQSPRVWVRTVPVDPDDPFRGRYVQLALVMRGEGFVRDSSGVLRGGRARLDVRGDSLVAVADSQGFAYIRDEYDGGVRLSEPVAFFIPERIADPSRRPAGEQLWAEVTVPRRGPPRPIRVGIARQGHVVPLGTD